MVDGAYEANDVQLASRRFAWRAPAAWALVALAYAAWEHRGWHPDLGFVLYHHLASASAALGTAIATARAFRRYKAAGRGRAAHVRADGSGVFIDGALALASDAIAAAHLESRRDGRLVAILTRRDGGAPLEIPVADQAGGHALLEALGFDSAKSTASYDGVTESSPDRVLGGIALAVLLTVLPTLVANAALPWLQQFSLWFAVRELLPILNALAVVWLVAKLAARGKLAVGEDGVRIERGGSRRFIPYGAVTEVAPSDAGGVPGVELVLGSSEVIALRFRRDDARCREAVLERLARAVESHGGRAIATDAYVESAVARRGRSGAEWLQAVRALAARDYRRAALPEDRLWRVVENPAATETARAGAAVALAPSLDDAGRARLRVAAVACAQPRMRVALDAAACGSGDDAIAEALEALHEAWVQDSTRSTTAMPPRTSGRREDS